MISTDEARDCLRNGKQLLCKMKLRMGVINVKIRALSGDLVTMHVSILNKDDYHIYENHFRLQHGEVQKSGGTRKCIDFERFFDFSLYTKKLKIKDLLE